MPVQISTCALLMARCSWPHWKMEMKPVSCDQVPSITSAVDVKILCAVQKFRQPIRLHGRLALVRLMLCTWTSVVHHCLDVRHVFCFQFAFDEYKRVASSRARCTRTPTAVVAPSFVWAHCSKSVTTSCALSIKELKSRWAACIWSSALDLYHSLMYYVYMHDA